MTERIDRVDQLIRLQSTGSSEELAYKLGISKRIVFDLFNMMRELGAEIYYSDTKRSYCYESRMKFERPSFKFIDRESMKNVVGGEKKTYHLLFNYCTNLQ